MHRFILSSRAISIGAEDSSGSEVTEGTKCIACVTCHATVEGLERNFSLFDFAVASSTTDGAGKILLYVSAIKVLERELE